MLDSRRDVAKTCEDMLRLGTTLIPRSATKCHEVPRVTDPTGPAAKQNGQTPAAAAEPPATALAFCKQQGLTGTDGTECDVLSNSIFSIAKCEAF